MVLINPSFDKKEQIRLIGVYKKAQDKRIRSEFKNEVLETEVEKTEEIK